MIRVGNKWVNLIGYERVGINKQIELVKYSCYLSDNVGANCMQYWLQIQYISYEVRL